jgi:hypothetical protein
MRHQGHRRHGAYVEMEEEDDGDDDDDDDDEKV